MKSSPQAFKDENIIKKEAVSTTDIAHYLESFRELIGNAEKVLKLKAKTKYYD